jgi:ABC-type Fe3+ transport system substrate-binding protein
MLLALACAPAAQPGPREPASSAPAAGAAEQTAAKPEWQVEWERTVAVARQEGKVVVNGPPGDLIRQRMLEGFRTAFPDITLEWSGGRSSDHATKMEAERSAGLYSVDVIIGGTTTALGQVRRMGALDPVKPALLLPEVTDPRNWLDHKLDFADKAGEYSLAFINVPVKVLIYDANQARLDEVDELEDLLNPKWREKIVVNDPTVAGAGNAYFKWFWAILGPERGAQFIRALKDQTGAVDRDQRRQIEWVARGRYPIALSPDSSFLGQLLQEGLKVSAVGEFKGHGGLATASYGSIMHINRAPHPNAAKVFINWLLTREGQTAYSTAMQEASRRLDVPHDHLPPELVVQPGGKYWSSYSEDAVEMPPALNSLLRELFPS